MAEIATSRELALEHPAFVAECGRRGHQVCVLEPCAERSDGAVGETSIDATAGTTGREGGVR